MNACGANAGMQELINQMGKPSEIAEEFNQNFPEAEKKKYRREKRWKILGCIACVLILLSGLGYWALPKQKALTESRIFQENQVLEQAESVILLFNEENYDVLAELSDPVLKDYVTEEFLQTAKEQVCRDWGEPVKIGNTYTAEITQMGKTSALIEMHVEYQNVNVLFTLSFTDQLKLQGFFMK